VSLFIGSFFQRNHAMNSERMSSAKVTFETQLKAHETSLDDLEELGEIMTEIFSRQEEIEVKFSWC
jgi:hypothetical protein